ncbi:nicotinamidase-related amidase [Pseudomonas nitritireducens]|uniref:Nicotinamidase-related amidase n=1 Tax=Pseudomonas nitroreducens TaxID=46680 RepID=A0A7W7KR44_PSENT|nr:cysteine hydrolase family protein [Pseudomonas nitritireducens]MBB4867045.1 nicotinamidase-related amidase [Pseudomonas nitritireducens]
MSTALLIIDVQSDLCTGDFACFDIDNVLQRINTISHAAREAGVPVVLVQHEDDDLQYGSAGWQLETRLLTADGDLKVRKTTPDSFLRTELGDLLQARGIDHLVICGLQSDYCVDTTTRRALAQGYAVTLVGDAHSTVANAVLSAAQISAHHNAVLGSISSFGPRARVVAAAAVRF